MPYAIVDKKGNFLKTRDKVYPTYNGCVRGYSAGLEDFLEEKFLYNNNLDYAVYVTWALNSIKELKNKRYEKESILKFFDRRYGLKKYSMASINELIDSIDEFRTKYRVAEVEQKVTIK